ncbi:MAG: queuosine salvage family protein [Candidatus Pacebacteria bacterium]|nr:queuosine salvage family protein [Candidatus Paceibacterota bacterium]MCF7863040.1 queuosine salvage family protein [Candidatus Paceibacterota bacterium]
MKLEVIKEDPFNILSTTRGVLENAQYVSIDENKINDDISNKISERFKKGIYDEYELGINLTDKLEDNLQIIFIENSVNFCFWPTKGEPKWEVEWPIGGKIFGGWFGLVNCFKRAMEENIPILDPKYLSSITLEDARKIFRGKNNIDIPLLEKRVENLREVGNILQEKFDGKIINLLKESNFDAIKIVKSILENFPCYKDVSILDNKKVVFLKRAQICANDFSYVLKNSENKITSLDKLTAYADYKLPQLLRMSGVINYEESLANKIDTLTELAHDSREEIEIRSATIWAVELLRQRIGILSSGEIDNTIWLLSQGIQKESKPYHRSRTIFY